MYAVRYIGLWAPLPPMRRAGPIGLGRMDLVTARPTGQAYGVGIAYHVDAELRAGIVAWDRNVTAAEWREHIKTTTAAYGAALAGRARLLIDLRLVEDADSLTDEVVEEIGGRILTAIRGPKADVKCAILAGRNWDRAKGFVNLDPAAREYVMVFNQVATACIWLGLPADKVTAALKELHARSSNDPSVPAG
jgi:hypothetical protein